MPLNISLMEMFFEPCNNGDYEVLEGKDKKGKKKIVYGAYISCVEGFMHSNGQPITQGQYNSVKQCPKCKGTGQQLTSDAEQTIAQLRSLGVL